MSMNPCALPVALFALALSWPAAAGESTIAEFRAAQQALLRETALAAFQARNDPEAEWYDRAVRCIEIAIDQACGMPNAERADVGAQRGRAAMRAGCDDPILLDAFAQLWPRDQLQNAERALRGMTERGDPVNLRVYTTTWQVHRLREAGQEAAMQAYADRLGGLMIELVESDLLGPERARLLAVMLESGVRVLPLEAVERFRTRLEAIDNVDPWIRALVAGWHEERTAWAKRGGDFAAEVRPEQWEGFHRHLDLAHEHFVAAHELHPDRPEAAARLISVSMGRRGPGDSERTWFDRAVAAQIDWGPAYAAMLQALLPRWGGSHEAMLAFGRECVATRRYDTTVPFQFAMALEKICVDVDDSSILGAEGVHDTMAELAEGYRAAVGEEIPPALSPGMTDAYWSMIEAMTAWASGRHADAAAALARDRRIELEPLTQFKIDQERMLREVHMYAGDAGPRLREADAAVAAGDLDAALTTLRELADDVRDRAPPRSRGLAEQYRSRQFDDRTWVHHRIAVIELRQKLAAGGWVRLEFDRDLAGWREQAGSWKIVAPRDPSGSAMGAGVVLLHDLPVGGRWELRGRFAIPGASESQWVNAAIFLHVRHGYGEIDWHAVTLRPVLDRVDVQRRWFADQRIEVAAPVDAEGRFHVQVWDESVAVHVDDRLVFADRAPGRGLLWRPGPLFGIGGLYPRGVGNDLVRFSRLELRLLDERPDVLPEPEQDSMRDG